MLSNRMVFWLCILLDLLKHHSILYSSANSNLLSCRDAHTLIQYLKIAVSFALFDIRTNPEILHLERKFDVDGNFEVGQKTLLKASGEISLNIVQEMYRSKDIIEQYILGSPYVQALHLQFKLFKLLIC